MADETFLASVGDGEIELPESLAKASQRHADLSERVNDARWRYYVLDAPTMSDGEFDAIMRELNELETPFPRCVRRTRRPSRSARRRRPRSLRSSTCSA